MDYRYLGRSALKVSPLCLGAMMFGGETDEATSARIIDKAFDQHQLHRHGRRHHAGRSEEVVGRAIASRRDSWVVATKFGYPAGPDAEPNRQGQSRKWIVESVDASLKRLGTDYIDILYFHRALTDAPLDEGMRAIADLIRQGKVRYFGLSNFKGWRIAEIVRLADQLGIDRPVASEPLQPRRSHGRGRTASGRRALRDRRRAVQPARARCIDWQICSRCAAARRFTRGPR